MSENYEVRNENESCALVLESDPYPFDTKIYFLIMLLENCSIITCAHHVSTSDWPVSTNDVKTLETSIVLSDLWAKLELNEATMVGS